MTMMDPKDVQALIDAPPQAAPTRNINLDVHAGYAAQRPYAALEDNLAFRSGYASFEEMRAAGADIERDAATGDWYRVKARPTGQSALADDGKTLMVEHVEDRRPVALTLAQAKAAQADFWDGFTWVLRGLKREKEYAANLGTQGGAPTKWVAAGPAPVLPQPSPTGALQPLPADADVVKAEAPKAPRVADTKKEG
jgi:hypothetical protein